MRAGWHVPRRCPGPNSAPVAAESRGAGFLLENPAISRGPQPDSGCDGLSSTRAGLARAVLHGLGSTRGPPSESIRLSNSAFGPMAVGIGEDCLMNRRAKGSEKFWSDPGAEAILQLRGLPGRDRDHESIRVGPRNRFQERSPLPARVVNACYLKPCRAPERGSRGSPADQI